LETSETETQNGLTGARHTAVAQTGKLTDMTRLGIVKEGAGETRVAATPDTVAKLLALGYEVIVERGAGAASSFPDSQYTNESIH
jgi:hypothetical protein